jgi:hypothetical protein
MGGNSGPGDNSNVLLCPRHLCDFAPNLRFQLKGIQLTLRTVTGYTSRVYGDAAHAAVYLSLISYSKLVSWHFPRIPKSYLSFHTYSKRVSRQGTTVPFQVGELEGEGDTS